jgi:hypothetical protein
MWYNGTELTSLARRALENEKVTMIAHNTGYIHYVYPEATIDESAFKLLKDKLAGFLEAVVDFETFINFLRDKTRYQKLFQLSFICLGNIKYIRMEKAFGYEHGSKNRLGDKTAKKLFCEIDEEALTFCEEPDRALVSSDDFLFRQKTNKEFFELLFQEHQMLAGNQEFIHDFKQFIHTVPQLPSSNKHFSPVLRIQFSPSKTREEIISYLRGIRTNSVVADLAFYAGRQMDSCDWQPFLKAAFERSPVSIEYFRDMDIDAVYHHLQSWPDDSIYSENRLSQPDEVVNFKRGDGIEKAITLANVIRHRHSGTKGELHIRAGEALLSFDQFKFRFVTAKTFPETRFSFLSPA